MGRQGQLITLDEPDADVERVTNLGGVPGEVADGVVVALPGVGEGVAGADLRGRVAWPLRAG